MSDGRKYYCICDSNCKFETMTKEQILAAITQAVETGSVGDCDTGFITKVKETNSGSCVTFWVGTQAQYNALATREQNCMYIITDDTTGADIAKLCENATAAAAEASATAGEALETAAAANSAAQFALQIANYMEAIDITNEVELSWIVGGGGSNLTQLDVEKEKYIYSPALGMVFYKIGIRYKGTLKANEIVKFNHAGGYPPTNTPKGIEAPAACYTGDSVKFEAAYRARFFNLVSCGDVDASQYGGGVSISGWYFCAGKEGAGYEV